MPTRDDRTEPEAKAREPRLIREALQRLRETLPPEQYARASARYIQELKSQRPRKRFADSD